jgi:hypothetical protein
VIHVRETPSPEEGVNHDVLDIHPNITMGMLLDALWSQDGSFTVRLCQSDEHWVTDYEVVAAG